MRPENERIPQGVAMIHSYPWYFDDGARCLPRSQPYLPRRRRWSAGAVSRDARSVRCWRGACEPISISNSTSGKDEAPLYVPHARSSLQLSSSRQVRARRTGILRFALRHGMEGSQS